MTVTHYGYYQKMVRSLHKELERKGKKLTHMKSKVMQPKIKNKNKFDCEHFEVAVGGRGAELNSFLPLKKSGAY